MDTIFELISNHAHTLLAVGLGLVVRRIERRKLIKKYRGNIDGLVDEMVDIRERQRNEDIIN